MDFEEEFEDDTYDSADADVRPRIYLAVFSTIVGLGFMESYWLRARKNSQH